MCHFPILVGIHPVANVQSRRRKNQCHTEKQSLQFCIFSCATDILSFDTRACHLGQKRKQRRKEKLHKQRMVCGQTNDVVETITGWADIDSTTHSSLISRHSHGCLSIFTRIFPYIPVFTRILPYSHVSSHIYTYLTIYSRIHMYLTIFTRILPHS